MSEEKKEEKPMKLPRFSYQVPEDLTSVFLKEMEEDFRETPGETITAILRKFFQQKTEARMLKQFTGSPEGGPIPHYGPKPSHSEAGQGKSQTEGAE